MIIQDYSKRQAGGTSSQGPLVICPVCGLVGAEQRKPWSTRFVHETQQHSGEAAYPSLFHDWPADGLYNGGHRSSGTITLVGR